MIQERIKQQHRKIRIARYALTSFTSHSKTWEKLFILESAGALPPSLEHAGLSCSLLNLHDVVYRQDEENFTKYFYHRGK